jgi:hypothetical protein
MIATTTIAAGENSLYGNSLENESVAIVTPTAHAAAADDNAEFKAAMQWRFYSGL